MMKIYFRIFILIIVIAATAVLYFQLRPQPEDVEVGKGQVASVETMARLCTVDIYSEVPVLDTINEKVIFGVQKQSGSVTFDLEDMVIDSSGDTVRAVLPRERVELYESTDKNSWEVIDTKAIGPLSLLRSDKFTLEEENAVKSHIKRKSIKYLYDNGTVSRARTEAARNLESFLSQIYRRPAVVTVTSPGPKDGSRPARKR